MHMQETELMKSCHNFIHLTSNTKKIDLNQIYLTQNSIVLCLQQVSLFDLNILWNLTCLRLYNKVTKLDCTWRSTQSIFGDETLEIKQIKTIELQYRCQQNYKLYNYWNSVADFRRYKIQASKVTLFAFYLKHA